MHPILIAASRFVIAPAFAFCISTILEIIANIKAIIDKTIHILSFLFSFMATPPAYKVQKQ